MNRLLPTFPIPKPHFISKGISNDPFTEFDIIVFFNPSPDYMATGDCLPFFQYLISTLHDHLLSMLMFLLL